jgi:outer membrane protein OmpA-like peptidoglycan-associated protein
MSTRARNMASAVAAMLMAGVAAVPAQAGEAWEFEITPYVWAAGIEGDAVVRGQAVEVDQSFSDTLEALDIAGALLLRAERKSWVLWTQVDYMELSTDELDNPPERGSFDTDVLLLTGGLGRNFSSANNRQSVDVILGARYMKLDSELSFNLLGTFTRDQSYLDPVLIVRPIFQLSERWRFEPMFSFGAGGDSESTYELQPMLQFDMTENVALRFGYRKLYYDIEDSAGGSTFDGSFHGLMVGIGGKFGGEPASTPAPPPPPAPVAQPAPPPPPPPAPTDTDRDGVVDGRDVCPETPAGHRVDAVGCSFDTTIQAYFDTDSATLKEESYADLNRLVDVLKRVPTIRGFIEGHTDSTGSAAYNQGLSDRRAAAVVSYLVERGIDPSRVEAKGYGESQPVASNDTAEGRGQNRRIVLRRVDDGT